MMSNRDPKASDVVWALIVGFVTAFGGYVLFRETVLFIVDTNYNIQRNTSDE